MYSEQLKPTVLAVESIYLDPNNPRFWTEANRALVSDKNTPAKQPGTIVEIDKHGIDDLYNSIMRNGFLLLDRIVVRPLADHDGKYVVVEGNRRFRSLMKLRLKIAAGEVVAEDVEEDTLQKLLDETNKIEVLVYNGEGKKDVSWMLQGIRHISGIRPWDPAQRAKLIAEQIDGEHKKPGVVGQQFGLSAQQANRFYKTYRALAQMREDDEFTGKAKNEYFSLFEAILQSNPLKNWMEWDEAARCFRHLGNIRRFYAWISEDTENNKRRRIHDPRQIKDLAYLIDNNQTGLLDEFENYEITIEEARARANSLDPKPKDWRRAMGQAISLLNQLPQSAIVEEAEEFLAELGKLSEAIETRRKMAESVLKGA